MAKAEHDGGEAPRRSHPPHFVAAQSSVSRWHILIDITYIQGAWCGRCETVVRWEHDRITEAEPFVLCDGVGDGRWVRKEVGKVKEGEGGRRGAGLVFHSK
eukprot:3703361-Rhodomonas_salina.1